MITQDNRPIAITTPFGKDKLLLRSFTCEESMNGGFEIHAAVLATDQSLAYDTIVGQTVGIRMSLDKGSAPRFFHGVVSSFLQQGRESNLAHYAMVIQPWFRFLDHSADCRIFQNESVPGIISKVFKEFGFSDYELQLTESYKPIEFCVQYRETAWNFISRLMEKEGIGYYFRHEEKKHVMVLTDSVSKHKASPEYDAVPYRESDTAGQILGAVSDWEVSRKALTGVYAHTDFDFKKPSANLLTKETVSRSHGMARFEVFDYPGAYLEEADGKRLAKAHIQDIQKGHDVYKATSTARGLAVGALFKLKDHPRADQNREYLILGVTLSFDAGSFSGEHAGSKGQGLPSTFSCDFVAIPSDQQFRPARHAQKHLVSGPQTAIVTGPAGEEIHTDEHGRVKVHFHWDRYGKFDADSSCWVRVSQLWAGKGWGAMHIPRIGQEVIVEFLEGDPDRPIITGRVYNGEAKPPYPLPASKNISTVKSESTKGGGGFNEIKMDDTKGKELLYIQAEKDRTVLVKNDNAETVKHDEKIEVGNDRTASIAKNESLTVGENETIDIGKKLSIKAGEEVSIVCGSASIKMTKDGKIEIVGVDVTMKSGGGKVNIDAGGIITIKGPMTKINT